jgi:type IV secretion system protein VirB8
MAMRVTDLEQYLEESRGLERDYLAELVRSRRSAWWVGSIGVGLAVLSMGMLLALLPLKRVEAFVVRVDNATGAVDVVSRIRDAQESYGEAVDRYFVNRYLLGRESYDFDTIQADYDQTLLFSSPSVQREYGALFEGDDARDKVLSNRVRILVKVRSITPTRDIAVVRFTRTTLPSDGSPFSEESLIATIGFRYVAAPMKEEDRRINPLGFQVVSYRVDPEVVK